MVAAVCFELKDKSDRKCGTEWYSGFESAIFKEINQRNQGCQKKNQGQRFIKMDLIAFTKSDYRQ